MSQPRRFMQGGPVTQFGKLTRRIESTLGRLLGTQPDGAAEPLDLVTGILHDVERQVEPSGGGRRRLPFTHIGIVVLAAGKLDQDRYASALDDLDDKIRERLREVACDPPARLHVAVQFVRKPRKHWSAEQRVELLYSRDTPAIGAAGREPAGTREPGGAKLGGAKLGGGKPGGAKPGTPRSGAARSDPAKPASAKAGALQPGATQAGAAQAGAIKTDAAKSGATTIDVTNAAPMNAASTNAGSMSPGSMNTDASDADATESGAIKEGVIEAGATGTGSTNDDVAKAGASRSRANRSGATRGGLARGGVTQQAAPATTTSGATTVPAVKLVILRGTAGRTSYALEQSIIRVGRGDDLSDASGRTRHNDIAFQEGDDDVNRTVARAQAHLRFDPARQEFRLFDDGSSNGTRVVRNAEVITVTPHGPRGVGIATGDILEFGRARVRFEIKS